MGMGFALSRVLGELRARRGPEDCRHNAPPYCALSDDGGCRYFWEGRELAQRQQESIRVRIIFINRILINNNLIFFLRIQASNEFEGGPLI